MKYNENVQELRTMLQKEMKGTYDLSTSRSMLSLDTENTS